jgi:hypothetical protein
MVTIDGEDREPWAHKAHVLPGLHRVRVTRADGSAAEEDVTVAAGQSAAVVVSEPPAPVGTGAPAVPLASSPPPAPSPAAAPSALLASKDVSKGPSRAAWVALGAAGALGIAGSATYVAFATDRARFEASADRDASLHAQATSARTATYVLWGAAGACAAVGLAFVLGGAFGSSREHDAPAGATLRLSPGAVSLSGTF